MTDAIGKVNINCAYDVMNPDGSTLFETGDHSMNGNDLNVNASTGLQSYYTKLINTADTNLTLEDYTKRQQAFLFTSTESNNPGQRYIPYGETADGMFVLSDSSRTTILERLGISED